MRAYYGVEDLGLTAAQRAAIVAALRQLGRNNADPNPCNRNHWRVRPDGLAVIFEASFNDDEWTVESIKNKLATALGINPTLITATVTQSIYGPVVTYARNGNRLRLVAFGGLLATWNESHTSVLNYLADNNAAWESEAL